MLKKGNMYLIQPTIKSLWVIPPHYKLKDVYYEAKLVSILKNHFVFFVEGFDGKCRMPFHSVEVYDIINKPMNKTSLKKLVIKTLEKFQKYGFKKMSDDDLRIILAHNQLNSHYKNDDYAFRIASNMESYFRDRGNIIRTLRNTYRFRDTQENRKECLNNL